MTEDAGQTGDRDAHPGTAGPRTVLLLHYTVRDEDSGRALETSAGSEPLTILYGQAGLPRAVQEALRGRPAGETVTVTLAPEQAFGVRREDARQRLPKKYFRDPKHLRPGMRTTLQTERGRQTVTVVKVGGKVVDVDTNHAYAGLTLTFVVELLAIRSASREEMAHGHAHGPGGHGH